MFCQNCGNEGENGSFCTNCGARIGEGNGVAPVKKSDIVIKNLTDNPNILKTEAGGCFEIYEYQKDLSVTPATAFNSYFMSKMNCKKRQVLCKLSGNSVRVQAGAMQWMAGRVSMDSNVKSAGDFISKAWKNLGTGESISKPIYAGNGYVMLEPTYRYILLEDVATWGEGMVIEDGMFLACDSTVQSDWVSRTNASSMLVGGEGWINHCLSGKGYAVLESTVPREEIIEIVLDNDEVRIDGNMAIAWSKTLDFSVEKSTKSLLGSWISKEGLVNVYKGTGKIWMAPVVPGTLMKQKHAPEEADKSSSEGLVGSFINTIFDKS